MKAQLKPTRASLRAMEARALGVQPDDEAAAAEADAAAKADSESSAAMATDDGGADGESSAKKARVVMSRMLAFFFLRLISRSHRYCC